MFLGGLPILEKWHQKIPILDFFSKFSEIIPNFLNYTKISSTFTKFPDYLPNFLTKYQMTLKPKPKIWYLVSREDL